MRREFEALSTEACKLKSEYLRSLAEFDNFRRRKERELEEFRAMANEALMLDLIPVLENFDRALAVRCSSQSVAELNGLRKGIELIYRQLKEVLARAGLEEYSCVGMPFDPRQCEAVSSIETDEHPEQTVVAETGKGYRYRSRVLRPALVVVAQRRTRPDETEAPACSPKPEESSA